MLKATKRQVLTGERVSASRNGKAGIRSASFQTYGISQFTIVNRMDNSMVVIDFECNPSRPPSSAEVPMQVQKRIADGKANHGVR